MTSPPTSEGAPINIKSSLITQIHTNPEHCPALPIHEVLYILSKASLFPSYFSQSLVHHRSSADLYLFRTSLATHTYQGLNISLIGTKHDQMNFHIHSALLARPEERLIGPLTVKEKGSKTPPQDGIPLQHNKRINAVTEKIM